MYAIATVAHLFFQAALLFWSALQSRHGFFREPTTLSIIVDFSVNVGAFVFATTLYASSPALLLAFLLAPSAILLALPPSTRSPERRATQATPKQNGSATKSELNDFPTRPFLTAYRGTMLVATCHAILAVDFRVFPRRFAKVETWGTSLMDMGVGSFVFSAGAVAAKNELKEKRNQARGKLGQSFFQSIFTSLRQAIPLFALGTVRLFSVKNLDYAEHVSEYGVHWNFFFTLALLPLTLCFLRPLLVRLPGPAHGYIGLLLAFTYEFALQTTSLKSWALTAPRDTLLTKNREGAVSWVGYLSIFLLGMETGTIILPRHPPQSSLLRPLLSHLRLDVKEHPTPRSSRAHLLLALALTSLLSTALLTPFRTPLLSVPISRRLANAPYALWVCAFNAAQILAFALIETLVFPGVHRAPTPRAEAAAVEAATSRILADFNAGGLVLFLAANLGTGAVNLGVDTLAVGREAAVGVLVGYMTALVGVAAAVRRWGLKI